MYLKTEKICFRDGFFGGYTQDPCLKFALCSTLIYHDVKVKNIFSLNEPDDLQQFVIIKRGN